MIRVLIVEDSPVQKELLVYLLEQDGAFAIVGAARDGAEAVEMAADLKPDVILMDFHMPRMNGLEATKEIMARTPCPIVIASASVVVDDVALTFEALRGGAVSVIHKPVDLDHPDHENQVGVLLRTLKLMSEVRVVRRWSQAKAPPVQPLALPPGRNVTVVAIGGSTGAPGVIAQILGVLPADFSAPILIVQHLTEGFAEGFATWLGQKTQLKVCLAIPGAGVTAGTVYLAPDGLHLGITKHSRIELSAASPEEGFRPSISHMFRSVAKARGASAMGVLLTGMGQDGVTGLLEIHRAGGLTIAQDEESCVVFGMPREAIRQGAIDRVLSPTAIAAAVKAVATAPQRVPNVRI